MALADFSPVHRSAPSPIARGLQAVAGWIAARHTARAQRNALQSLLFAPEYRLDDIGITREQLVGAIEARGGAVPRQEFWS